MFRFPVWLVMVAMLLALAAQHSGALNLATIQHGRRALLRSTSTATKLEKAGIHASDGVKYVRSSTTLRLSDSDTSGDVMDEEVREAIEKIVKSHKVVLFMKGDSSAPMCGFSSTACQVLNLLNTPYATVNVLDNPEIRAGIKVFSSWPTIPQLYVAGEFVGGTDIMVEMYNSGELAEMVELANAN